VAPVCLISCSETVSAGPNQRMDSSIRGRVVVVVIGKGLNARKATINRQHDAGDESRGIAEQKMKRSGTGKDAGRAGYNYNAL
jgi:hypothetical protein